MSQVFKNLNLQVRNNIGMDIFAHPDAFIKYVSFSGHRDLQSYSIPMFFQSTTDQTTAYVVKTAVVF